MIAFGITNISTSRFLMLLRSTGRNFTGIFNRTVDYRHPQGIFNHMVEQKEASLDRVFHALSDPSRRRILKSLAGRERTVGELAEPLAMSLAAASKHIKMLERAGLMRRTKRGRTHYCR